MPFVRRRASLPAVSALAVFAALGFGSSSAARELTFDQRVEAQQAIEQVYWKHRIWPKENPSPKPTLATVMTPSVVRGKVDDYLRKSTALEKWWHRPVTAAQLQAELDRMSRQTHDPEMLRELYTALGNDPFLIAETLARQTLVDRLTRSWYDSDDRFHASTRSSIEASLLRSPAVEDMKSLGGAYRQETFARDAGTDDAWKTRLENLAALYHARSDAIPVRRVSGLQEDSGAWFVTAVLALDAKDIVVASVTWAKPSLDDWWSTERSVTSAVVTPSGDSFSATAPSGVTCTDDTWDLELYAPPGRSGHSAVWTGTEMIIWGGSNTANYMNTGYRYNPATNVWTPINTTMAPSARSGHTAVWTGNRMIVWGGGIGYPDATRSGGLYDPATDTWSAVSEGAGVPSARRGHTAVWTGSRMIVWGGNNGTSILTNSGGSYDPSTNTWTAVSQDGGPTARDGHTAVWTGSLMIVWGGNDGSQYNTNTGGRYDPQSDSWTSTSTGANVPLYRSHHLAVSTGSEMIVWGGSNAYPFPSDLGDGGRYNPASDTWVSVPAPTLLRGAGYAAVWTGTEMILWGGSQIAGARYSSASGTWSMTTTLNAPPASSFPTGVWTGSEMIVWGGGSSTGSSYTGGRYDPATDSWVRTLSVPGLPSGRQQHTAIWTGTELIVWGGFDSVRVNTGGRYDTATGNWTATSQGANVPSARSGHTAVWSGTEMIVWGDDLYSNTGGRYDPASDTWAATSTGANVPTGRHAATAVWTGSEMIVWGGETGNASQLNTGGRYDPASDLWTPVSIGANVPSARSYHTAVWTGSEMIVWGGWDHLSTNFLSGGRYAPLTDSWTPTSTGANVPSARDVHTAVWTGTKMIIWGGTTGSPTYGNPGLATGGMYDPGSDSWTPVATAGAPPARKNHTAVWTGQEMIAWGGSPGGEYSAMDTGGRYDPSLGSWKPTSLISTPSPRRYPSAVWTGEKMLVWGGWPIDVNLGLYCVPCSAEPPAIGFARSSKSGTTVSFIWDLAPLATRYDVVRGAIASWPVGAGVESCLAADVTGSSVNDADVPNADTGFWYLLRGKNACGSGTYGSQGAHGVPTTPRISAACP